MLGTLVNFIAVIIGSLIGLSLKQGISENMNKSLMSALSLGVVYIGVTSLNANTDGLFIIVSLVIGTFIGEKLKLDDKIQQMGHKLEKKLNRGNVANGFITAVLIFCVGAMSILGAIEGAQGEHTIYFTKAILDGVTAIMLATTLGIGVLLSAFAVLLYQGSLVLIVTMLSSIFTEAALVDIGVLGGIMIMALGFNILGMTKIKVANMIPALLIPILWHLF